MPDKTTATKSHQCNFCNRRFARSEHLQRHITTHTLEKSFRCFCGKRFARRDLLKRHERLGKHLAQSLPWPETPGSGATSSPTTESDPPPSTNPTLHSSSIENAASHVPLTSDEPHYGDLFHSNTFQSFDAFINTMGLEAPFNFVLPDALNERFYTAANEEMSANNLEANFTPVVPDADPENVHELKRIPCLWTVTQKQRDNVEAALQPYQQALSGFVLPSALAISRYLTGYMEDFQDHQAILHIATYRPQDSPGDPELLLAICANGAATRYEKLSADRLFYASKAVIDLQWSQTASGPSDIRSAQCRGQTRTSSASRALRIAQAAMLLSTFAIMEGRPTLIREVASLHGLLVEFVREGGVVNDSDPCTGSWQNWIFEESSRRTQCAIFNILNMHTMALDTAPVLPSALLAVPLPCSTPEWTATNESNWLSAKRQAPKPVSFPQAYAALFDASAPQAPSHSPLGNLVLINAILQRIYFARQLQLDCTCETLRAPDLEEIEVALERWTLAWKEAPESILDPRNPDASNSFTSTSYLGLAYVRLHATYGARRRLCDWQPKMSGASLHQAPWPERTPRIESALLHAAQAFAIPVKFGIEYLGRKQFHRWDLQNFIWHLEAAVFLSKWFLTVAETCHLNYLTDFESRLISVVNNLVQKAEESIDPDLLREANHTTNQSALAIAASLSGRVARLWACLYNKQNSPWGLVNMIGETLAEYERLMPKLSRSLDADQEMPQHQAPWLDTFAPTNASTETQT